MTLKANIVGLRWDIEDLRSASIIYVWRSVKVLSDIYVGVKTTTLDTGTTEVVHTAMTLKSNEKDLETEEQRVRVTSMHWLIWRSLWLG